jgi:NAD(P)H-flavin reductase
MSSTPIAVRVVKQYDDGEDARHLTLEPLETGASAPNVAPGQFFMLSVPGYGEAAFTYASLPDARGRFDALVRRVGSLTTRLFELEQDAVLGVRGPFGRGWPLAELAGERVVVLAGGCGLAPLCAAIDSLAAADASRVALVYGSRTPAAQVLSAERGRWGDRITLLETLDVPDDDASQVRGTPLVRLPEALDALGGGADAALVCGPELMMTRSASALRDRGMPAERIWLSLERRMHCGDGRCGHCYLGTSYVCTDGPTYRLDVLQRLQSESPPRAAVLTEIHHC